MRFEEIRKFLEEKFKKEKRRLKSHGYKVSSYDLSNAVSRHVEALMCDSRYRELKKLSKKFKKSYLQERLKVTKAMSKALMNTAKDEESKRVWKTKKKK